MNNACLFIICQETGNKVAMEVVSSEDRLALEQAGCREPTNTYYLSKYQKLVEEYPFSLECYYFAIQQFSFTTKFVELDTDIVDAFIKNYQFVSLKKAPTSEYQKSLLANLQKKLDTELSSFANGAFVRLSRRSPKDAILECDMCRKRVEDILLQLLSTIPSGSVEQEIKAVMQAFVHGMKVANGKEAMELIMASERVFHDMLLAADFPKAKLAGEGKFFVNILMRDWKDIPIEAEFRAFVYQRNITAISQYCDIFYFGKEYVSRRPFYEKLIRETYLQVQNILPMESCILDFAVLEDGTVYIVELNPFKHTTGGSLFDWSRDLEILENRQPFEFRMIEEPIDNLMDFIDFIDSTKISGAREKLNKKEQSCAIC